jgi:hypothetical protein
VFERNHCASSSRAKTFFESSGYKIERDSFSVRARLKTRHLLISTAEEIGGNSSWQTGVVCRNIESLFMRSSNTIAARATLRRSATQAGLIAFGKTCRSARR